MKDQLYICNKVNDPRCPGCQHGHPHKRWSLDRFMCRDKDVCTEYTECYDRGGSPLPFKVRCVKIKGE